MYTYQSLAQEYNVSPDTIRKQLDKLAADSPNTDLKRKVGRSWVVTEAGANALAVARGESVVTISDDTRPQTYAIARYNSPVVKLFESPFTTTVTPSDIMQVYNTRDIEDEINNTLAQIVIESENYRMKKELFEQAVLNKARAEGVALALKAHQEKVAAFDGAQAHFLGTIQ